MDNFILKEINNAEWSKIWNILEFSNLLQSWEYGEVKSLSKWKVSRYLIENNKNVKIAIFQVLYINLKFIGGIARINRGPIFIDKNLSDDSEIIEKTIKAIIKESKKRKWRILFFAPELQNNYLNKKIMKSLSFKKRKVPEWGSLKISLQNNEDYLFKSLKSKWRNLLRKSIKSKSKITKIDLKGEKFENFLLTYKEFQNNKKFIGVSEKFLRNMFLINSDKWKIYLYVAEKEESYCNEKRNLGSLLSIQHGKTATYLIGISNEKGRKFNINYLLLWEAIISAKENKCLWFDLGGLNDNTPKGIKHFKEGTNGTFYELIGEFWKFIF